MLREWIGKHISVHQRPFSNSGYGFGTRASKFRRGGCGCGRYCIVRGAEGVGEGCGTFHNPW